MMAPKPSLKSIIQAALKASGFGVEQIVGLNHDRVFVAWRAAICFVAVEYGYTKSRVSREIRRDHSSVANYFATYSRNTWIHEITSQIRSVLAASASGRVELPECLLATQGQRIVAARIESGMTRSQLAWKIGISDRTVGKWERGDSVPAQQVVHDLARALNKPAGWIKYGDRDKIVQVVAASRIYPKAVAPFPPGADKALLAGVSIQQLSELYPDWLGLDA